MNRETIERAAMETARKACAHYDEAFEYANGFVTGADWRINSVWHGMNEKPSGMFAILAEFGEEEYSLGITLDGMESAKRWAYVADLLPDRKEADQ